MSKKQLAELRALDKLLAVSHPCGALSKRLAIHAARSGVIVGPDHTGLRAKKKAAMRKTPKKKRP